MHLAYTMLLPSTAPWLHSFQPSVHGPKKLPSLAPAAAQSCRHPKELAGISRNELVSLTTLMDSS